MIRTRQTIQASLGNSAGTERATVVYLAMQGVFVESEANLPLIDRKEMTEIWASWIEA